MVCSRCGKRRGATARVLIATAAMAATLTAQQAKFDTFTATTANLSSGAAAHLTINVMRWSSDEDRDRLVAAFGTNGDAHLVDSLPANAPAAGYVWGQEPLGYTVRYAYRQPLPHGGTRVILLTDPSLGSWTGHPWAAKENDGGVTPNYPFTLIELRLNASGVGEGKMSATTRVAIDQAAHMVALENFAAAPVLLKGVTQQGR